LYFPKIPIKGDRAGKSPWRFTGKTMGLCLLLIVVAGLIGSFYLNQASHVATAGLEIMNLTANREGLRQDNADLRRQIAELEALPSVKARAKALGYGDSEGVEYLSVDILPEGPADEGPSASIPAQDSDSARPRSVSSEVARWWEELTTLFESWVSVQP
jgi:hypothetical protein